MVYGEIKVFQQTTASHVSVAMPTDAAASHALLHSVICCAYCTFTKKRAGEHRTAAEADAMSQLFCSD